MNPDRAIATILTTSLVVVLGIGIWLLWVARRSEPPPAVPTLPPVALALPTETPATRTVAPPAAAAGHRLAGTVVGDVRFAIIEDPHGGNALYRPGQTVPGLGELVDIAEDHITVMGSDGSFDLRLAAAPTATDTPVRAAPPTDVPLTRTPRQPRDRSASESLP